MRRLSDVGAAIRLPLRENCAAHPNMSDTQGILPQFTPCSDRLPQINYVPLYSPENIRKPSKRITLLPCSPKEQSGRGKNAKCGNMG